MSGRPFKIGVAGTHSTGKSTFIGKVRSALEGKGLKVVGVDDLAKRAHGFGFPILTEHTFESTLWIMAECMRQEAEASLRADVILVDRPVPDALGYLLAALEVSGRTQDPRRIEQLTAIARAHARDYDFLTVTVLDPDIALGEGRDTDARFRFAAAKHMTTIMADFAPTVRRMTSSNSNEIVADVLQAISARSISSIRSA
ncbi:AAA family ATPase [Mesorhizobium temperatum]|uniref:Uncharacterized protein n=1 Tax=Mesorhizobium temperatum TaxID=241416 RepID=A0A271LH75_9HYPH|nr:AAA family ATPase [Mesorhizobium temperatum]PAQ06725.1 hypothetical protein CIT26_24405 [Mesorhizobium temperatum]